MYQRAQIMVLIGLTSFLHTSAALSSPEAAPPSEIRQGSSINLARDATTQFSFDLYRQLASESDDNLFCSPYSVAAVLALAAEGARGETALEMGKVLGLPKVARRTGRGSEQMPWQISWLNRSFSDLTRRYHPSERSGLRFANAIWAEKTFRFAPAYVDAVGRFTELGGVFPCDFKSNSRREAEAINRWVASRTANRITGLIDPRTLGADTRMVLTNAIYFRGDWAKPFEERSTKLRPFQLATGQAIETQTMHQWNDVPYAAFHGDGSPFETPRVVPWDNHRTGAIETYPDEKGFQVVELPYRNSPLSMMIILPRSATGLASVENRLNAKFYRDCAKQMQNRDARIFLPKFKMDCGYELRQILEGLGIKRAFKDPRLLNGADFSGMTADPESRLGISSVIHKAFVDVAEKGTEAAAASAVIFPEAAAAPTDVIPFDPEFNVDRPFLFIIRDRTEGAVLFIGRVSDPRSASQ